MTTAISALPNQEPCPSPPANAITRGAPGQGEVRAGPCATIQRSQSRDKASAEAYDEEQPLLPGSKKSLELQAREAWGEVKQKYAAIIVAVVWIFVGVLYLTLVEHFDVLQALYITTQLITTVGYGDFPINTRMECFLSIYLLGCIIWVAFAISQYIDTVTDLSTSFLRKEMRALEQTLGVARDDRDARKVLGKFNDLMSSTLLFLVMIVVGAVFYALVEGCTCKHGWGAIEGCQVGPSCKSTGGLILSWRSSFYFSVVTLTTCGFGDRYPTTRWGMAFYIVWVIVGITATANFVRAFTSYFFQYWRKSYLLREKLTVDLMQKMDTAANGEVSREEFIRYLLVKFELVSKEVLDDMDKQFELFDRHHRGFVKYNSVEDVYSTQDALEEGLLSRTITALNPWG